MPSTLTVSNDRRTRSKSPGRRDRDRSHSRDTRARSPPRKEDRRSDKRYSDSSSDSESEDDRRDRDRRSSKKYYDSPSDDDKRRRTKSSKKYADSDSEDSDRNKHSRREKSKRDKKRDDSGSDRDRKGSKKDKSGRKHSKESESSGSEDISISIHRKSKSKHENEKGDGRSSSFSKQQYEYPPGYAPAPPIGYHDTRHMSYVGGDPRYAPTGGYLQQPQGSSHQRAGSFSGGRHNDEREGGKSDKQYIKTYNAKGEPQLVEVKPEYERHRDKKYHDDKYGSSTDDMSRKLSHLAVGTGLGAATLAVARHGSHDGGKPPASPLLESYRGTYQSISPMPGALVLSKHKNDSDLSDFELDYGSDASNDSNGDLKRKIKKLEREKDQHRKDRHEDLETLTLVRSRKDSDTGVRDLHEGRLESDASLMVTKRVTFYDPREDAKKIASALEGTHRPPNLVPIIRILPRLSSDNIFQLRAEYKNYAKIGGQGINMAKHIKMRVPGNIGKAAYATALGRWESEAHWANSWYQGGASRRELLIESLMGRSNSDIREIKNCFKDKRYNDDLTRCIKAELKADKFRDAILLALDERRMPESSPLSSRLVKADVEDLYRALRSSGGESAMIQIIVLRSNAHLREVLRVFERYYKLKFAQEMIIKSKNLVGETLAHILNGALNRPMRDALLLHQAIIEMEPGKDRTELIISRLIRLHWEPRHLAKVKLVYEQRYINSVEVAFHKGVFGYIKTEEGTQWAEFCIGLLRSA